ncbi:noncanonical pyrimidine nucleotidase, YjjG family [Orenia metallireducens]|uniref:Noncanonical pyrimidine nucleotidase, YjjG family n=1 Tax=Orenia metallireducens TaxID=1413210 RepID=A0A1C0A8V1_9FIRM|nr:YjjG family noncanonical pyrimidine nucleotidase [Orenia metallireducens]OCL26667.1 noncanonical pyrimidine nucleotidase, YjjG family [Orenia metallireducens]
MKYEVILFDADRTLFDFDKAEEHALEQLMNYFEVEYQKEYHLKQYQLINKKLWEELEQELVTPDELKIERFRRLAEELELKIEEQDLSEKYLEFLAEGYFLLKGALKLIKYLHKDYKLAIVTNGLATVQKGRLKASPLKDYFDHLIISEEIGVAKPNPKIFEHTFKEIGHQDKSNVLIVGDSLSSDIQGGINFGIDTCWFNPHNQENLTDLKPTYEISELNELKIVLSGK